MTTFNDLWALLCQHGSSAKRETECAALWAGYTPEVQQHIPSHRANRHHFRQTRKHARNLFAIASTVTKRRVEAGDKRRRPVIFKEVYASLKTQLQRVRNGGKTEAERRQVLSKI